MKRMMILLGVVFAGLLLLAGGCEKPPPPSGVVEISGPEGMVTTVRGQRFNKTPLRLELTPNVYIFKFSAPGFVDGYRRVELKADERRKVAVELEEVSASILINTRPPGAEVLINGRVKGATPLVLDGVKRGSYSGQLRLPGFAERGIDWTVEDERPKQIMIDLNENIGTLVVSSTPKGAQLFINDRAVGVTPYSTQLGEGKYRIRLEMSGFVPVEQQVTLSRGQELSQTYPLTPKPGGVMVTSVPDGASVFVNNIKRGVTPCMLEDLRPAVYQLRAEKEGYEPVERTVEVTSGMKDDIRFSLTKSTGVLELTVRPAGVAVQLDGRPLGVSEPDGVSSAGTKPFTVEGISPGRHTVTVSHPRANPLERTLTVEIKKGELCRPAPIDVWVANCEIRYKTGLTEVGVLYEDTPQRIYFSPEPGVKVQIDRDRLEYVKMLTDTP